MTDVIVNSLYNGKIVFEIDAQYYSYYLKKQDNKWYVVERYYVSYPKPDYSFLAVSDEEAFRLYILGLIPLDYEIDSEKRKEKPRFKVKMGRRKVYRDDKLPAMKGTTQ